MNIILWLIIVALIMGGAFATMYHFIVEPAEQAYERGERGYYPKWMEK